MVLITGVIKNTDGTPYVGSVKFALNDLGIELNTVYLPTVVTVDSDGTFTVDLWPNTNSLTPSYYKCSLDNGSVFNISIPGNNPSYNLGDVILIDPETLDPGILQRLNLIESSITTRVGDLENYTGIADNRIPSIAISGDYPDAVAGKVSKVLTIGDGLTGGTYRGDTDVTVAVDGTVVRDTDDRLSDAREWVSPTAPLEVVSQPTNNTRYAWTPQRIWDTIVSWFSTITSDDIQEGGDNLYYTDSRVASNPDVQANTTKVSATGSVTTHSDVTSAGSGQIITTPERTKLAALNSDDYLPAGDTAVNSQLLDNLDSTQFLRSDISGTASARIVFLGSQTGNMSSLTATNLGGLEVRSSDFGNQNAAFIAFHKPGYAAYFGLDTDNQFKVGGWSMGANSYRLWHEGNDGAGSGLDADLWGGWQRDNYLNQAVRDDSNVSFSGLSFGSTTKQHINLWSTSYGLGVQTDTSYWRSNNNFALFKLGVHSDTALEAGSGGIRVFDYQGLVNQFNFNAYVNFNADGLKITGVSPTLHLEDTDHRSFWLHNNSNTFYILSDRNDDGAWEAPYPAYWNDISQKSYFWGNEVAVHNTTPKFSGIDVYNGTKKFGLNTLTDNFLYIQQFAGDNQTFEGNIIRFSTTEVRHYAPLVNGSSRHIKDIKGDLPDGLYLVNSLNPVVYNYKGQDNTEVGLIAEEVPPDSHLIYGSGPDMAIDYTKLPIYMIDAIQQLTKRIEALEEKAKKQ